MRFRRNIFFAKILCLFYVSAIAQINPNNDNLTKSYKTTEVEETSDPEINRIAAILQDVENKSNFIEFLSADSNVVLPAGLIKQVGAARYIIAVDSMRFQPNGAHLSAYAAVDFPGTNRKICFRASHVKFNPSGVIGGDQAKLFLASNHYIKINQSVSLRLLSNGQNWVEWDCNGFKAINLTGHFVFRKSKLLPDPTETTDSVVTASFHIYTHDIHNFVADVSITPFKIAGLDDWAFKVLNATVDMSELVNASSMTFPPGYLNPNLIAPQMWTGFFLQQLKIKLPTEISHVGKHTEIEARNILIEHTGVTGTIQINNLFKMGDGTMSGWDFSIDELGAGFICNQLSSGHLKGRIDIPIVDSTQTLQYTADISHNPITNQTDYNFLLNPANGLRFPVFHANVNLAPSSVIHVTRENGFFKPTAVLTGSISFDHKNFDSKNTYLAFQNLTIKSEAPYITNGVFSLNNIANGKLQACDYPVNLNSVTFGINQGSPVLGFDVSFNLSDMVSTPLTVGTNILLKGKIESRMQTYQTEKGKPAITFTKSRWSFDKLDVSGVGIDIQTAPFTLKGNVNFKEDENYGRGFFGGLDFSLRKFLEDPIAANVGFGKKEDFKYFFVDAKIPSKYIVPGTPVGISRIIGGMYYHMTPSKTTENDFLSLNSAFNNISGNALSYSPNSLSSLGLRAGCTGEFLLNEKAANGDLCLDIDFTNSGGLGQISLTGNVYSMASISKRANAPIRGRINLSFDPQTRTFDALSQVNMSYYSIVNGIAPFKIHTEPGKWYVCAGRPSNPATVRFLNLAESPGYFMTGNDIESASGLPASVTNQRNAMNLSNGSGFCAGAKISSKFDKHFGVDILNVHAYFDFNLGFDMMMTDYGENANCGGNDKAGINGRIAQGNMYIEMKTDISATGHIKFPADCPTSNEVCAFGACVTVNVPCILDTDFNVGIFSSGINDVISARVPKPLYFSGSFTKPYNILGKKSGDLRIDYSYGADCNPVSN